MLRWRFRRGQMGVNNLIYTLIILFVAAGLFPMVYSAIDMLMNSTTDPVVKTVIALIPLAIVAGILNTIVSFGQPGGYRGY